MNRRDFLWSSSVASVGLTFARPGRLFAGSTAPGDWRTFDVTTRVEILKSAGITRIWIPGALLNPTPFQKTLANKFAAEGGTARLIENVSDSLGIIAAEFPAGVKPLLTVTSRVATQNLAVDTSAPGKPPNADRAELAHEIADLWFHTFVLLAQQGMSPEDVWEELRGRRRD